MSKNKLFSAITILSLLGMILAIYLLWEQWFQPPYRPCTINSFINCDAIISGEVAKTFGIPTPLYGLVGYSIILFASLFRFRKLMFSMAGFGLVFCLWIGYRELFELKVICPICIACQLIMISVFSISFIVLRKNN